MLNNTFVHNTASTSVNVKVEQANVHDAARLLSEMEVKALDRFVDSLTLKNNIIEGKVFKSVDVRGIGYDLAFRINGKPMMSHVEVDYELDVQKRIESIVETLGKRIAVELLITLEAQDQRVFFT